MNASHLSALKSRHAELEDRLSREFSRPAPDDRAIAELKRQKLRLKDEIAAQH